MKTLESKRQAAIEKLMTIGTARRGQLSKQYYKRKGKDGKVRRSGPYYVWQRWVNGKKHSIRIPSSSVAQVQADLERGREVQDIFNELWGVMEQIAIDQDKDSKKKSKSSKEHLDGKSASS
jgi:hypothetical protein